MSEVLLKAQGVSKVYRMGRCDLPVLRRCDLEVRNGEFVAIMGKSGSGKSTLLHLLGALDSPDEGQVHFGGEPLFVRRDNGAAIAGEGAAPRARYKTRFEGLLGLLFIDSADERRRVRMRRRHFGFVFQFYHLLPELSVLENVLIARMIAASIFQWPGERAAARAAAVEILTRVGLSERLRHKPSELSGGERQRVAVARALVHRPRILFADEPTGNLDATNGAALMDLLRELHRGGQTIVMVTHDASIAGYADHVLHLESGRLRNSD